MKRSTALALALTASIVILAVARRGAAMPFPGPLILSPFDPRAYLPEGELEPVTETLPPPWQPPLIDTELERVETFLDPWELWGAGDPWGPGPAPPPAIHPVQWSAPLMDEQKNVSAFLAVIREVESGNDYMVIAGGDRFTDFTLHPFEAAPQRPRPAGTTASGAYQIILQTWKEMQMRYQLPDFSPASQDAAAVGLLIRRAAYSDVRAGRFTQAVSKLTREWEAFAKILAGQYPYSFADTQQLYLAAGGTLETTIA